MIHSLGRVTTTAGALVRLTNAAVTPTQRQPAHSFLVQTIESNTGRVFLYDRAGGTKAMGVLAVLAIPTANSIPAFNATVSSTVASFDLSNIWIDVEVGGEGVYVSFVQA